VGQIADSARLVSVRLVRVGARRSGLIWAGQTEGFMWLAVGRPV